MATAVDRPAMLVVDDDPEVLAALQGDLRARYGQRYRVVTASGGQQALDTVRGLVVRDTPLALVVTDQRMPGVTGVDLVAAARAAVPSRFAAVLVTAYADTDVAIRAINEVDLDYYITKPWSPPEDELYPVIDDLLADWEAHRPAGSGGLRLVGHRWSRDAHRLRDFLARNHVPFSWLDADEHVEARALLAAIDEAVELPLVVLPDGTRLERPTNAEVAGAVHLAAEPASPYYDLVIVGAGPGGLAAAVYGASEGLSTAVVEREAPGGQAGQSSRIDNYLGFPSGIAGSDLARRALTQAQRFGAQLVTPAEVHGVTVEDGYRVLRLVDGREVRCRALVIATGVSYNRLDGDGLEELAGVGVFYGAAATEADSVTGQPVHIVGGGNSAGQAAMFFSAHAQQVTILLRGGELRAKMSDYLVRQIDRTDNIDVRTGVEIVAAEGDGRLRTLHLRDRATGRVRAVASAALFIFIGASPRTGWLPDDVRRDERGFVLTGSALGDTRFPSDDGEPRRPSLLETSVPGVFAVGDVRANSVKRVASAVGEGSVAVQFAHRYLGR